MIYFSNLKGVMWCQTILICTLLHTTTCFMKQRFPSWFKFGSSTSAYQVEGAWNISDKSENRFDYLAHLHPEIGLRDADFACDSYHQWRRDVEIVSELGLQFYRFSISWTRLLPSGFSNHISEDGKRYYNNLIDGLLEKGIEPVVTIYHFDLPQSLVDLGGWTNPGITDWYADYARVVFSLFGARVKTWITINEPQMECDVITGWLGIKDPNEEHNVAAFLCNKNILVAHAKAWRIYDQEFRHKDKGTISLTNHMVWVMPFSPEDEKLTELARQYITGRYSHPIFSKEGGWPPAIEAQIERVGKEYGYSRARLPPFTEEEIELVRGTFDFYGMNYYTSYLVRPRRPWEQASSFPLSSIAELKAVYEFKPGWSFGYNKLFPINPEGLRQQMHWLRKQYGDIKILITENGYSTTGSNLNDDERIAFIKAHLEQVLLSINDGINVTGYGYWSLMDSYEWLDEFKSKFGLYEVDFSDPLKKRIPRKSAVFFSNIIKHRSLLFKPLCNINYY